MAKAKATTSKPKKTRAVTPKEKKVEQPPELKKHEQYYIDSHPQLTDAEIAVELEKPVESVREYRFERSNQTHANRMLHRPAKGVVAMTEASSMAADDRTRHMVTNLEVKRAIAEGDLEKAAKLQKQLKEQEHVEATKMKDMYKDRVHYMGRK